VPVSITHDARQQIAREAWPQQLGTLRQMHFRCVVAALSALALVPVGASARTAERITVNRSIGLVRLGMTETEVEAALGGPADRVFRRHGEHVLHYATMDVGFASSPALFAGERVVSIRTTSRLARTSNGIGPGAARSSLRRGLGGRRLYCFRGSGQTTLARATTCFVGAEGFGTKGTSFTLRGSRISRVDVYVVLNPE
jgi:hypothetical protein